MGRPKDHKKKPAAAKAPVPKVVVVKKPAPKKSPPKKAPAKEKAPPKKLGKSPVVPPQAQTRSTAPKPAPRGPVGPGGGLLRGPRGPNFKWTEEERIWVAEKAEESLKKPRKKGKGHNPQYPNWRQIREDAIRELDGWTDATAPSTDAMAKQYKKYKREQSENVEIVYVPRGARVVYVDKRHPAGRR